jgi:hypothetical protein
MTKPFEGKIYFLKINGIVLYEDARCKKRGEK